MEPILQPESSLADRVATAIAAGMEQTTALLNFLRQRQGELRKELERAKASQRSAQDAMVDISGRTASEPHPVRKAELHTALATARASFIEVTAAISGLEEEVGQLTRPINELSEASERQKFTVFTEESRPMMVEVQERLAGLKAHVKEELDTIKTLAQRMSAAYGGWNEQAELLRFPQTKLTLQGAAAVLPALEGLALHVPNLAVQPSVWVMLSPNAAHKGVRGGPIKVTTEEARDLTSRRYDGWTFARYLEPAEVAELEHTQVAN